MSEVKLVQMSKNPVGLMYLAARNCYSAGGPFGLIEQTEDKSSEDMWKLVGNVLESGHHCYDDQTEVLTKQGFKYWANISEEDLIASVVPGTHDVTFVHPTSIVREYYSGHMYYFKNKYIDLCVTPNHRLYTSIVNSVQDRIRLNYTFHQCEDIIYKNTRKSMRIAAEKVQKFRTCANISSTNVYNPFKLPISKIEPFNKLIGFFIGDGYAIGGDRLEFHLRKQRKVDYLRQVTQELGFLFVERANDKYNVVYEGIGKYARQHYYKGQEKMIPPELIGCSTQCTLAFIDGMRNSDGCHYSKTSFTYVTTSKSCADTLQAMVHTHGGYASIKYKQGEGRRNAQYHLEVNLSNLHANVYVNDSRHTTHDVTKIPYQGYVYCCTVPTGLLMVRRNNKICLSGNSIAEHVYFTFVVEGMPRYTMAQVTRHRHCSFAIQSQRYVEIKEDLDNLKVLYNATLKEDMGAVACLKNILNKYFTDVDDDNFLILTGILMCYLQAIKTGKKAEDARMILPNCTKTNMVMSVNLRELIHIAELRLCNRAQADIQDMVQQMCDLVISQEPLFKNLLAKPCVKYGKCKEAHPCTEK